MASSIQRRLQCLEALLTLVSLITIASSTMSSGRSSASNASLASTQPQRLVIIPAMSPPAASSSNCAALASFCVCMTNVDAQCFDTNAQDISFLNDLRNRSQLSDVLVYHNNIHTLRNNTFQSLQLTNLKRIRLAYNGIVTIEPRAFRGLRNLTRLGLARNNIRYLHQITFQNATKLSLIDLSNNQISDIKAVKSIPNLEECRLTDNSITNLPPRAFCGSLSCRLNSIHLANNEIRTVDSLAFAGLSSLETLNLSENDIAALHSVTFANTTKLRELDLRGNRITIINFVCQIPSLKYFFLMENRVTEITNETFSCGHTSSLTYIDLSGNRISSIAHAAFRGLTAAVDILLAKNEISYIHPKTFTNTTNLQTLDLRNNRISQLHFIREITMLWNLDLSGNEINEVPPETFFHQNLTMLVDGAGDEGNVTNVKFIISRTITIVNLAKNRLTSLETGALEGLTKLHHLDLSGNNISYLSPDVFEDNTQLAILNLNGNRVASVDTILTFPSLEACDLTGNGITSFPSLPPLQESRLEELHLPLNNMTHLPPNAFSGFRNLKLLNLTANHLNATAFAASAPVLAHLFIAKNNITALPRRAFATAGSASHLRTLDVSYNAISSVNETAFEGLGSLITLNMSHNRISALHTRTFGLTPNLQSLNLSRNRLMQLSFMIHLTRIKYFYAANNSISSLAENTFWHSFALSTLDLSGNSIANVGDAVFRSMQNLRMLDVSSNGLRVLAADAFCNTTHLSHLRLSHNRLPNAAFLASASRLEECDLSHNQVTSLPQQLVSAGAPHLTRLDLSHNRLSSVGADAFAGLPFLQSLNLNGNALSALPATAFAGCPALLQLGLAGNRLTRLADVPHAPRLKHLYVWGNRVARLANDSFAASRLAQVVHLNVSRCGVSAVEAGALRPLRVLRYLDLSHNAIAALPAGLFAQNTLLAALDVSHNRLSSLDGAPPLLRPATSLEFLDASANAIAAVPAGAFGDQLRYIDLSRNAITHVAPTAFDGLGRLQVLDVSWNNISALSTTDMEEGSLVLTTGNPVAGESNASGAGTAIALQKHRLNLYDISISELDKFAKLYVWILGVNGTHT